MPETKVLRLRYPARCARCHNELAPGTEAQWDYEAKTATCLSCIGHDPESEGRTEALVTAASEAAGELDRGVAGASAAREWKRRHERREREVRAKWGPLGGIALALSEDPQSTSAWAYGANGEAKLGRLLDPLRDEGMAVLHDRRIPGTRANIDHLVVAPWGVFVIDAKNYKGWSSDAIAAASSRGTIGST
jgi:hypothetical protein